MRWLVVACALLVAAPVVAQVNYRPTDPPIVTAENDVWFQRGEPIVFAGDFYYAAGPVVFFNGDHMVRTGYYNGVPLYADTTIEPYSVVLVPIGRGRMQPYERIRGGELAGTTGSRAPSFPGRTDRQPISYPVEAITTYTPESGAVATTGLTTGTSAREITAEESIVPRARVRGKPFSYDSISIQFMGEKWVMAGSSGPLRSGLIQVAEYRNFPVYAEQGRERIRIYLQIAPGRFAPFKPQD